MSILKRFGSCLFNSAIWIIILLITFGFSIGCVSTVQGGTDADQAATQHVAIVFNDSSGTTITLPHIAQRIICVNEDACQMLIAFGAGESVVGVSDYMIKNRPQFMPLMPNAQSIGDWQIPNVERIVALNPDIVITYGSSMPKNADQLIAANLTLVPLDCYKIPNLPSDARTLGKITGTNELAESYATEVEEYMDILEMRINTIASKEKPVRAYIEGYQDYSTFGKQGQGSLIANMLHMESISANNTMNSFTVSPEWIVSENPDVIVKIAITPFPTNPSLTTIRERIIERPGFDQITAVKQGKVFVVNTDIINDPRGVAGLLYIAKSVYPDQFVDINPNDFLKMYSDEFILGFDNVETIIPVA